MVSSREAPSLAGPRHYYRVRITPEQPDFRLLVMPASNSQPDACVLRQGGNLEATVFIGRIDGFDGAINLSAEGLPEGVTCPPQVVGLTATQATLVLSASDNAPAWTGSVTVVGTATIGGQPVRRVARSATITWASPQQQQNIPAVSRLDRGLPLAVRDRGPFRLRAELDRPTVEHGEKATATVKLERFWPDFKGQVQISAVGLPNGLTFNNQNIAAGQGELKPTLDIKPNVAPGVYTIVFRGQADVPFAKDPNAKQKPNVNVTFPSTPVTLTIYPKELAKVTVNVNTPNRKAGQFAEVVVRVNRQSNYAGPFQVELVVPDDVKGLAKIDPITLPASQNEVKLTIPIEPDAAEGMCAEPHSQGHVPISRQDDHAGGEVRPGCGQIVLGLGSRDPCETTLRAVSLRGWLVMSRPSRGGWATLFSGRTPTPLPPGGASVQFSYMMYDPVPDLDELARRMEVVAGLGYRGIELSASHPLGYDINDLAALAERQGLPVVSMLSGWSYPNERLCLSSPDASVRAPRGRALGDYVRAAGRLGALLVVGLMQGLRCDEPDESIANDRIVEGLTRVARASPRNRTPRSSSSR